jgi:hypothetical protein
MRPGLATISLKVDHICIISIQFGGNWLFTGFYNMFFDNNFLFFVTVMMTAGGLQSKFCKKTTYAFFPYGLIAFDSLQDFKIIF